MPCGRGKLQRKPKAGNNLYSRHSSLCFWHSLATSLCAIHQAFKKKAAIHSIYPSNDRLFRKKNHSKRRYSLYLLLFFVQLFLSVTEVRVAEEKRRPKLRNTHWFSPVQNHTALMRPASTNALFQQPGAFCALFVSMQHPLFIMPACTASLSSSQQVDSLWRGALWLVTTTPTVVRRLYHRLTRI